MQYIEQHCPILHFALYFVLYCNVVLCYTFQNHENVSITICWAIQMQILYFSLPNSAGEMQEKVVRN